jgi:hypothetical protein
MVLPTLLLTLRVFRMLPGQAVGDITSETLNHALTTMLCMLCVLCTAEGRVARRARRREASKARREVVMSEKRALKAAVSQLSNNQRLGIDRSCLRSDLHTAKFKDATHVTWAMCTGNIKAQALRKLQLLRVRISL